MYLSPLLSRPRVLLVSLCVILLALTAIAGGFKPREGGEIPTYDLSDDPVIEGEGVTFSFEEVGTRQQIIEPKELTVIKVSITNHLDRAFYPHEVLATNPEGRFSKQSVEELSVFRAGSHKGGSMLGPSLSAQYEIEKFGDDGFYLFDIVPTPNYRGFVNSTLPGEPLAKVHF